MRGKTVGVLCAGTLALGASAVTVWAGGLDPGYNSPGGFAAAPLSTTADRFQGTTPGPNGGVYAVGFTTSPSARTDQQFAVARILASGKLDPSFGSGGVASINVRTGGTAEIASGVVVQSVGFNAGKIVVSGQAESAADPLDTDIYVVRFNPNGTPDTTFGDTPGTAVRVLNLSPGDVPSPTAPPPAVVRSPDTTWGLLKQADDRLVLVAARGIGATGTQNATRTDRDLGAIRLNPDGSRDSTFGSNGVAMVGAVFTEGGVTINPAESPRGGLIQPDGKIVVAGYGSVDGANRPLLARFNANGTPDASFGSAGGAPGLTTADLGPTAFAEIDEIGLQGTSYVTTGSGMQTQASSIDTLSMRFRANGALDTTYGTNGFVWFDGQGQDDYGRSLEVLPDKRIFVAGSTEALVGGSAQANAMGLLLTANGQRDASFGSNGVVRVDLGGPGDAFFGATLLVTGKVIAAGYKGGTTAAGDDSATARFDVGYVPTAPVASIAAIRHNSTLSRGPLRLSGTVTPTTDVTKVVLRLTQGKGASCRAYQPAKLAFSGRSCQTNRGGFAASYAKGRWAFELANRLPMGTYQLDVVAHAGSGIVQPIKLGKNRIRFTVAP